ncbi:MAG: c-type cytochrome [Kofleriaceae bacterium]|nr:c-type cytochrome [Myxococcales bacterium]MCB9562974.1 c-type cytochrome [Kofleriaceae bacterium]MCB9572364.1 c-type cytochrome [Kofleriaceae bacterium]
MTTLRVSLTVAALAAALAAGAAACSKSEADKGGGGTQPAASGASTTTATSVVKPDPAKKAAEIFAQRCTPCHGAEGRGDGAASAGLDPKPRNFHDAEWQASVTDEHIQTIVHVGGAAVGKSAAMPSNPDLSDPAVLAAIKDYVRALGKQP